MGQGDQRERGVKGGSDAVPEERDAGSAQKRGLLQPDDEDPDSQCQGQPRPRDPMQGLEFDKGAAQGRAILATQGGNSPVVADRLFRSSPGPDTSRG